MSDTITKEKVDVESLIETITGKHLVVHNDDINTFEWVIESLIKICKHTIEQAEQCAYIIHHKGKYAVKRGTFDHLKPMKDALIDRGINATLD